MTFQINIFDAEYPSSTYEDWCEINKLDPSDDENYNSYCEWKANS